MSTNTLNTKGLEKSIEFRFFMIFSCFIFFVDTTLLILGHGGFQASIKSFEFRASLIPQSVMVLGCFYLIMALVFPVMRRLIQLLLVWSSSKLPMSEKPDVSNSDKAFVSTVKRKALLEKDSFWLAEIEKREKEIAERETNLNINFSLLFLVLVNWLAVGTSSEISIVQYVIEANEFELSWFLSWFIHFSTVVFCVFLVFATFSSLSTDLDEKIFYPEQPKPNVTKEEFNRSLMESSSTD